MGRFGSGCAPALPGSRTRQNMSNANKSLSNTWWRPSMAKSTCTIFDEAGFGKEPYIPYSWQDRGSVAKTPGRAGKRINVIGAYSLMAGNIQTEMFDRNIKSDDVVAFLDKLSEKREKPLVVMVDNASI